MQVNWKGNHAVVGPFKLNIRKLRDEFCWEASTPGYTGAGNYRCKTEEQARAEAEKWAEEQLVKFLVDVGINPNTALDGTIKCPDCYGTGRWGSNGAEEHGPCKGTGRIPKPAERCPYGCEDGIVTHMGWAGQPKLSEVIRFKAPCPRHGEKLGVVHA